MSAETLPFSPTCDENKEGRNEQKKFKRSTENQGG